MPYPRIHDDGQSVTLDLHGATIDEACDLAVRLVRHAARRGRGTAKIIHGQSTGNAYAPARTIKQALYDLLDRGAFDDVVIHAWRAEGHLLLSLDVTSAPDPRPIRLLDLM
jgi:hypothetical protein